MRQQIQRAHRALVRGGDYAAAGVLLRESAGRSNVFLGGRAEDYRIESALVAEGMVGRQVASGHVVYS